MSKKRPIHISERSAQSAKSGRANARLVSLSFKVPLEFRLQFKLLATQKGLTMNELLHVAFESMRKGDPRFDALSDGTRAAESATGVLPSREPRETVDTPAGSTTG